MTTNTTEIRKYIGLRLQIIGVLEHSDIPMITSDISERIINQYPETLERKIEQKGSDNNARVELRRELSSIMASREGKDFIIDRNEKPYQYSLVDNDEDIDDEIDIILNETEDDDTGYVYILDTHVYTETGDSIVKIGKAIDVEKRLSQLDREQSSYQKHTVIEAFHVMRPYKVEHAIHNALDYGRLNPKKEGFKKSYVDGQMDLIRAIVRNFEI